MKLTTSILLAAMATGSAWAQNLDVIQDTKDTVHAVGQKAETDRNAAYSASQSPSQPVSKPAATPAKPAVATKPAAAQKTTTHESKPAVAKAPAKAKASKAAVTELTIAPVAQQPKQGAQKAGSQASAKKAVAKKADPMLPPKKAAAKTEKPVPAAKEATAETADASENKGKKTITAEGRRDPFISPVVSRSTGPGCSTGKRCLAIDQISVRGVVKADSGMIAVVVNSLNKAYFLKENDPVYNGYVMKITGDSVVFKETFQDRLGKDSTREVVKKLTTPAV